MQHVVARQPLFASRPRGADSGHSGGMLLGGHEAHRRRAFRLQFSQKFAVQRDSPNRLLLRIESQARTVSFAMESSNRRISVPFGCQDLRKESRQASTIQRVLRVRDDHQMSAGHKDSVSLRKETREILDVMNDIDSEGECEPMIRKWELFRSVTMHKRHLRSPTARLMQHGLREVESGIDQLAS